MNTIELFSGTKSFSKVAEKLGHKIYTIDNNKELNPDLCISVFDIQSAYLPKCDILWTSPPCTAFSVAAIGKNWHKETKEPKTENAQLGIDIVNETIKIIADKLRINPYLIWFIENPRGMLRKLIDSLFIKHGIINYKRNTVTYCQYGDTRMKPTDIWTNLQSWKSKPICKNGAPCHVAAPRGSRTGTQGLKNAKDRGVIPEQLFYEIFGEL